MATDNPFILEGEWEPKLFEEPLSFTFIPHPGADEIHMTAVLVRFEVRKNEYGHMKKWYYFQATNGYEFSFCFDDSEIFT